MGRPSSLFFSLVAVVTASKCAGFIMVVANSKSKQLHLDVVPPIANLGGRQQQQIQQQKVTRRMPSNTEYATTRYSSSSSSSPLFVLDRTNDSFKAPTSLPFKIRNVLLLFFRTLQQSSVRYRNHSNNNNKSFCLGRSGWLFLTASTKKNAQTQTFDSSGKRYLSFLLATALAMVAAWFGPYSLPPSAHATTTSISTTTTTTIMVAKTATQQQDADVAVSKTLETEMAHGVDNDATSSTSSNDDMQQQTPIENEQGQKKEVMMKEEKKQELVLAKRQSNDDVAANDDAIASVEDTDSEGEEDAPTLLQQQKSSILVSSELAKKGGGILVATTGSGALLVAGKRFHTKQQQKQGRRDNDGELDGTVSAATMMGNSDATSSLETPFIDDVGSVVAQDDLYLPLKDPKYVRARKQPKSPSEEMGLSARYAAIPDIGERAFQILVDLGMIEVHD
jgi:hypothetical protein